MKSTFRKILWGFLALVLVQSACLCNLTNLLGTPAPTSGLPATEIPATPELNLPTQAAPTQPIPAEVYPPPFAPYNLASVSLPQTFAGGGYSLPLELGQVQGLDLFSLSAEQRNLLSKNGFVVASPLVGQFREFYQVYDSGRYDQVPMFVTTDSVFHVYHLIFDKMLRDLETTYFIPNLRSLTKIMLAAAGDQYQSLRGSALEEPALRNAAYFAVADWLLGLSDPFPAEADDLASAELALINAGSGPTYSPIWDRPDLAPDMRLIEDYSQYIPRGHYTRSEDLKMFFKAMMWYGRLTFRQVDDFETRRALLLVQALRSASASHGIPAIQIWQSIYEPTVFIVGKADDLGYVEYGALSDQVFETNPDLNKFADPALFASFQLLTKNLPPPQINSMWVWINQDKPTVTKGFRFMGQRFTLDEYVFGQVIWRNVGTLQDPRGLPKGLDFFAAMGSEEAYNILKDLGETEYANYDTQLAKVKGEFAALGTDTWTQNLYWSWLYALQPFIATKGSAYPPFMQTQAWNRKDLQAALGSWTELKHDTLLYAKQVMAEMGGGAPPEPPHGYVEPNPEAYARLLALAQMTRAGLEGRGVLSDLTRGNLDNLIDALEFLKDVSERELNGGAITAEQYWRIQYWGGELEQFTLAAADTSGEGGRPILEDQKAALVADVATGTTDLQTLVVLEEAIGQPTPIYVVLPDSPWRVALGAVYSYYEFTVPPADRMTDDTWQAMLQAGSNPAQPAWTQLFITP